VAPTTSWRRPAQIAVAVAAAAYVAHPWLGAGSVGGRAVVSNLGQLLAAGIATVACLAAARRQRQRADRRAWALVGLAALSWTVGQAAWTWFEVVRSVQVPFPSVADVGYLAAVPFFMFGMLSFPHIPDGTSRIRIGLDGLIVALTLLYVSWTLVLGPAVMSSEGTLLEQMISLAYPIGDVITLTITVIALTRAAAAHRSSLWFAGAGLALLAVADSHFVYSTLQDAESVGTIADVSWFGGWLLLALGAADDLGQRRTVSRRLPRLQLLLPYFLLPLVFVTEVWRQIAGLPIAGTEFWIGMAVVALLVVRQVLVVIENHSLTRSLEDSLARYEHQASHDPLTGLPNRALVTSHIQRALEDPELEADGMGVALLFVDLDRFKTINDSLGHEAGDTVLVTVAGRLLAGVSAGDMVARFGGDEFLVLRRRAHGAASVAHLAERLREAVAAPMVVNGQDLVVTCSVGMTLTTPGGGAAGALIRDADLAMFKAKELGRARVEPFDVGLRERPLARLTLERELRRAVEQREFEVYYQPVIELATHRVVAAEALLRWRHPSRGLLTPDAFLTVAEEIGVLPAIGDKLVPRVCRTFADLNRARPEDAQLTVAVNLSSRQLDEPRLVESTWAALERSGLDPSRFCFEVSEDVIERSELTLRTLSALRQLGVRLAIDDFGTGYSSLRQLRRFPVDILKIDKSFVDGLGDVEDDTAIVTAVINLARSLGLVTVAEGVETREQAEVLTRLGGTYAQGWWFAKAMPIEDLVRVLQRPAAPVGADVLGEHRP
jgi:diguanylate cyclase (GGDEF)-like protein